MADARRPVYSAEEILERLFRSKQPTPEAERYPLIDQVENFLRQTRGGSSCRSPHGC
jgi:hypothetical protein